MKATCHLVTQSLLQPEGLFRTLGEPRLCTDLFERPVVLSGGKAIVAKAELDGRMMRLKCYTDPAPAHFDTIYGAHLHRRELQLPKAGIEPLDVLAEEWIEGSTLDRTVRKACLEGDRGRLKTLSVRFDRMAAAMLADDRAHGDLKPENIIVGPDCALHPIDWDAAFLPAFRGMRSLELGTPAYRHPARTAALFNERLDDFPAAVISASLAALALDPALHACAASRECLLLDADAILGSAPLCREVIRLLEESGDLAHASIVRTAAAPTPEIPELIPLFVSIVQSVV